VSTQPKSVSAFANTTVQFSAVASGSPTLVYWWQLNGTNISQLVDSANFTGANSNVLTVLNATSNDLGTYQLMVTNNYGMAVSSNAVLTLVQKYLVGRWIGGTNSDLTDLSGFSPTGTHDGYDIANSGGAYYFTNDVPPGRTGVSLYVSNDGIAINNSSTLDAAYTNTFDATINNAMSVAFWARGWPGGWNPFVSKNGDSGSPNAGWDIRNDGNDNTSPCFTCRGAGGTVNLGTAVYGNAEDMAATSLTYGNDNKWHHYASTFNAASGTRYLWVDGKIAASASGVHAYNLASYAHVVLGGIDHSPGNTFAAFFTGKLYDVRIYNYDLSSNEVQVLSALPDPLINPQPPAALTGFVGLTAQISAVETGTAPLTNQWQWNGANLTDGPFNGATITGSTSNVLTIANLTTSVQGVFHLVLSNPKGLTISSNTVLSVYPTAPQPAANLVGEWLSGVTNLTDTSGYSPAGTHDGYGALAGGGPSPFYAFTNDVPSGQVGYSLVLSSGTTGIAISNSSSLDANYTNTFDNQINTSMTVECWAKGVPGGWNPFVSKFGESESGWQLRVNGSSDPCWSMRGAGGTDDMASGTATEGTRWHHYAGTYDSVAGIRSLYVDGQLAVQQTGQALYTLAPAAHLAIGAKDAAAGNSFGNFFSGRIYDVRIFNTALSQAQVNAALLPAQSSAPVFGGPPVLMGNNFVLTWSSGYLLSATNVAGPWTHTGASSPYTNNVTTAPMMFYKLSSQ
jgi:hypothetical protein